MTIGMRIDAAIASLESLPRTNPEILYATLIGASLIFSFAVINSGTGSPMAMPMPEDGYKDSLNKPKKISNPSEPDEPQPKWHILRLTNYVVTFGFLLSVLKFALNATTYLEDSTSLLQFLFIWSISMCYFFGFFGISFVELDELECEPQNHQHQMALKPMLPAKERCVF